MSGANGPVSISGEQILNNFFSGFTTEVLVRSMVRSFDTKEGLFEMLEIVFNEQIKLFGDSMRPALANDLGSYSKLEEEVKKTFELVKNRFGNT